jgi:hypothetical protein
LLANKEGVGNEFVSVVKNRYLLQEKSYEKMRIYQNFIDTILDSNLSVFIL